MADRATVANVTQIGVESTAGTAVAANKLLASLEVTGGVKASAKLFRPQGRKYGSFAVPGKEWSEWKLGGQPTYGELAYILCGLLKAVTPTNDTTNGKLWTFTPALSAEDAVKTYTLEQGSAFRAHKAAYGLITEYGLTFTRDSIEQSGKLLAQAIVDGITLTAAPSAIETPVQPVLPATATVKLADTWAGLAGASASPRILKVGWNISDRFGPLWVLDASKTSYVAHVETAPKVELKLLVEADATGMALLDLQRAATAKFVRIAASGPDIDVGKPFLLQIDGCYNVTDVSDFQDEDGVYAVEFTLACVYDPTAAKSLEVQVRNKLAAL